MTLVALKALAERVKALVDADRDHEWVAVRDLVAQIEGL